LKFSFIFCLSGESWSFFADHRIVLSESLDQPSSNSASAAGAAAGGALSTASAHRAIVTKSCSVAAGASSSFRITDAGIVLALAAV